MFSAIRRNYQAMIRGVNYGNTIFLRYLPPKFSFVMRRIFVAMVLLFSAMVVVSCSKSRQFDSVWSSSFRELGTSSSPKCTDLNRDGILEVVVGAARNYY
jgi:hypothetical protein